jgi:hypothetical protein
MLVKSLLIDVMIRGRDPLPSLWRGCSSLTVDCNCGTGISSDKRLLPPTIRSIFFVTVKHRS